MTLPYRDCALFELPIPICRDGDVFMGRTIVHCAKMRRGISGGFLAIFGVDSGWKLC